MVTSVNSDVSPTGLDLDTWTGAFCRGTIMRILKEVKAENPTIKYISQSPVQMYKRSTKCLLVTAKTTSVEVHIENDPTDESNLTEFINYFVDDVLSRMKEEEHLVNILPVTDKLTCDNDMKEHIDVNMCQEVSSSKSSLPPDTNMAETEISTTGNTLNDVPNQNIPDLHTANNNVPSQDTSGCHPANNDVPSQDTSGCHPANDDVPSQDTSANQLGNDKDSFLDAQKNFQVISPLISFKTSPFAYGRDHVASSSSSRSLTARVRDATLYLTAQTMAFSEVFRLYVSNDLGPNPKTTGYVTALQLAEVFFEELRCRSGGSHKLPQTSLMSVLRRRIQIGLLSLLKAIRRPFCRVLNHRHVLSHSPRSWPDCPFHTDDLGNDDADVNEVSTDTCRDTDNEVRQRVTNISKVNVDVASDEDRQHGHLSGRADDSPIRVQTTGGGGSTASGTRDQEVLPLEAELMGQPKSSQPKRMGFFGRIRYAFKRMCSRV